MHCNLQQTRWLLVAIVTTIFMTARTDGFLCYTCSYIRTVDPSVNYGCITEPGNVTRGMTTLPCEAPYLCITLAQYNQDMSHIRSVVRSCQIQQAVCSGIDCCNRAGTYPMCEFKCRDDLCNAGNPERRLQTATPADDNGTSGGSSIFPSAIVVVMSVVCRFQNNLSV